jgi:CelD/BcsL family acetyltransferase involved in cellulose biosynthesis
VLSAEVVDNVEGLAPCHGEWDDLAVRRERPLSAPVWALGWWRHLRPADAILRVILLRDGEHLVGVAPFFAVGGFYSMLGGDFGAAEILALPGRESEVGAAVAAALAAAEPRSSLIALRYRTSSPEWPTLLDAGWPDGGSAWGRDPDPVTIPLIELDEDGVEGWLATRNPNFRQDTRRLRRKIKADGGSFRISTEETHERDVDEFLGLHRRRHPEPGETVLVGDSVAPTLVEAGTALLPSGRFRLYNLEFEGRTVGAGLFLVAGPRALAWNSGFDDAYRSYGPPIQCVVRALEDAAERGETTIDLGEGDQRYKQRMASGEEARRERLIIPPGRAQRLDLLRLRASELRHRLRPMLKKGH